MDLILYRMVVDPPVPKPISGAQKSKDKMKGKLWCLHGPHTGIGIMSLHRIGMIFSIGRQEGEAPAGLSPALMFPGSVIKPIKIGAPLWDLAWDGQNQEDPQGARTLSRRVPSPTRLVPHSAPVHMLA